MPHIVSHLKLAMQMPTGNVQPRDSSGSDDPDLTNAHLVAFSWHLVAAARALESQRWDRLFNDPFAKLLVRGQRQFL